MYERKRRVPFTKEHDEEIKRLHDEYGDDFKRIAAIFNEKFPYAQHSYKSIKDRYKKHIICVNSFTKEEDELLLKLMKDNYSYSQLTKVFIGRSNQQIYARHMKLQRREKKRKEMIMSASPGIESTTMDEYSIFDVFEENEEEQVSV
jgi:hypothetical protein